jgi:hypothetical protein
MVSGSVDGVTRQWIELTVLLANHLLAVFVCPYPLWAIPGFLALVALVLTCVAAFNCNFFKISFGFANITQDVSVRVGLLIVQSNDFWPADDDRDSSFF